MAPGSKPRTSVRNGSKTAAGRSAPSPSSIRSRTVWLFDRTARWLALVLVVMVTVLLVIPGLRPVSKEYVEGQVPTEHITATVSFSVPDEDKAERLRRQAMDEAKGIYTLRLDAAERAAALVEEVLEKAAELRDKQPDAQRSRLAAELADWVAERQELDMPIKTAQGVIDRVAQPNGAQSLLSSFITVIETLYSERRIVDDLSRYRSYDEKGRVLLTNRGSATPRHQDALRQEQVVDFLRKQVFARQNIATALKVETRELVAHLAEVYVRPDLIWEMRRSQELLRENLSQIHPIRSIGKGQVVVREGEALSRDDLMVLQRMHIAYAQTFYKREVAIVLYVVLLCILVFYYIRQFRPDIRFDTRNVFLVALPVLLALFAGRVGLQVFESERAAGYAFPAGLIGMLAVILFDVRSAVLMVTVGCLAFSIPTGLDFKVFITSLLGGYAAVTVLTSVQERKEVLKAGFVVGVVNGLVILLVNLMDDPNELEPHLIVWGIANGLLCGVFAMPALTLFESMLGVVTDIRLLELTGLGHPLLERIEREAPGSYQHSLNVMKLSEAAAKAIGANFLLVRAGSLYHDIGKIVKPKYFGENQISLEEKSLHGKISPYMSAMVIKNHVKAGIELARQYKVPQRIVDFIPQHHGTTIISFFYHEALKRFENSESTDPVREADFRYPGPKPQSIETAIVMLADSVEATVTSRFTSLSVNEDELYLVVQRSVLSKFNDGQFDQCDLTFRDLEEIRRSFVNTLLSRFHHRVAYPTSTALSGPAAPPPRRDRMERDAEPALSRAER